MRRTISMNAGAESKKAFEGTIALHPALITRLASRRNARDIGAGGIAAPGYMQKSKNLANKKSRLGSPQSESLIRPAHSSPSGKTRENTVIIDLDGGGPLQPFQVWCRIDELSPTSLNKNQSVEVDALNNKHNADEGDEQQGIVSITESRFVSIKTILPHNSIGLSTVVHGETEPGTIKVCPF